MNVLVFGGTGKTGSLAVERALAKGHTITRTDLANFLVDQLETDANLNSAVRVINTWETCTFFQCFFTGSPCILFPWI